jgi:hypothetical protein
MASELIGRYGDYLMQTAPLRPQPSGRPPRRSRRREWLIALVIVAVVIGGAGYAGITALRHALTSPPTYTAGCGVGTGPNAVPLTVGQAQIAATIAAVAAQMDLPTKALTIAYATAMQESKLENLSYGTADSVGVFQQRPSQGWGTVTELENPVYATTAFFKALVKVPNYTTLAIAVAAQDVQRSADGSAYNNYASEAVVMSPAFTTGHGLTCWNGTGEAVVKLDLHGAAEGLDTDFGVPGTSSSALDSITRVDSGQADSIVTTANAGWTTANWLVANAAVYGITRVSYDGYTWTQEVGSTSWRRTSTSSAASIVAS